MLLGLAFIAYLNNYVTTPVSEFNPENSAVEKMSNAMLSYNHREKMS
jgi:hypothetical protein